MWRRENRVIFVGDGRGMQREKNKFGPAVQSLLCIYCSVTNHRLESNRK
jgi:hypothetical protein